MDHMTPQGLDNITVPSALLHEKRQAVSSDRFRGAKISRFAKTAALNAYTVTEVRNGLLVEPLD